MYISLLRNKIKLRNNQEIGYTVPQPDPKKYWTIRFKAEFFGV
jgi:hypothetical protein